MPGRFSLHQGVGKHVDNSVALFVGWLLCAPKLVEESGITIL